VDGHSSREIDLINFVSGICSESFIKPLKWLRYLLAVLTILRFWEIPIDARVQLEIVESNRVN
jgi:hypothetical protein